MKTWIRLDDDVPTHPKMVGRSDRAFAAWVRGVCWCSHHLTDGFMPGPVVSQLIAPRNTRITVQELVEAGLWEQRDGGYLVHDFLEYQTSAAQVEEARQQKSEAGRRGGWASGRSRRKKADQ